MGYKLAGLDVIGNCEIDRRMNDIYIKNHRPRYNFNVDIRNFLNQRLPNELYNLDILDGSPPCSVFSISARNVVGKFGSEKRFREGQREQRLDNLFLEFIKVARKFRPKIVIAENVKGLILGKAKGYVHEILHEFDNAGYDCQIFLLNSAFMQVPQARERLFFIARRKDLDLPKISLDFDFPPIPFGEIRSPHGADFTDPSGKQKFYLDYRLPTDTNIQDIYKRNPYEKSYGRRSNSIISDHQVCRTLTSAGCIYRMCDGLMLSVADMIAVQTFPTDFDFGESTGLFGIKYLLGMSVPPFMMRNVVSEVCKQWLRP